MWNRRRFNDGCAMACFLGLPPARPAQSETAAGRITLRLRETAGLRRFNYPVHATLPAKASSSNFRQRLSRDGTEVPAQFRRIDLGGGRSVSALDFNASLGPFEVADYVLEFGPAQPAGNEPSQGLVTSISGRNFVVSNPPFLNYSIPRNLAGLVESIKTSDREYLATESKGLFLGERGGSSKTALRIDSNGGMFESGWTKEGTTSVGLRFRGTLVTPSRLRLRTSVEFNFVNSKSWIETNWTIEDAEDRIATMGVHFKMKIEGSPALVDCGASSTVYSHLKKSEGLTFTGRPLTPPESRVPRWSIEQGPENDRKLFAAATDSAAAPEGWIHLMDNSRCSALALDQFAARTIDRFNVDAAGKMEIERHFSEAGSPGHSAGQKSIKFWLHVVPMPVQVGAVTSPQSMLSPLRVEWLD